MPAKKASRSVNDRALSAAAKAERRLRKKAKAKIDRELLADKIAKVSCQDQEEQVVPTFSSPEAEKAELTISDEVSPVCIDITEERRRSSRRRSKSVDVSIISFTQVDSLKHRRRNTGDAWDVLPREGRAEAFEITSYDLESTHSSIIWSYMSTFKEQAVVATSPAKDEITELPEAHAHQDSTLEEEDKIADVDDVDEAAAVLLDFIENFGPVDSMTVATNETFEFEENLHKIATAEVHVVSDVDTPTNFDVETASVLGFIRSLDDKVISSILPCAETSKVEESSNWLLNFVTTLGDASPESPPLGDAEGPRSTNIAISLADNPSLASQKLRNEPARAPTVSKQSTTSKTTGTAPKSVQRATAVTTSAKKTSRCDKAIAAVAKAERRLRKKAKAKADREESKKIAKIPCQPQKDQESVLPPAAEPTILRVENKSDSSEFKKEQRYFRQRSKSVDVCNVSADLLLKSMNERHSH
ncbi:hypothetical protein HDU97_004692 [Phlyctochytrium planicorne]|nr:hypothetical protein HDU97_004692 [Phlyctochytrium planicorne]